MLNEWERMNERERMTEPEQQRWRETELKIHIPTRDRMVHTKEEMQKDRDTERVK